jgi:hypothetical protein
MPNDKEIELVFKINVEGQHKLIEFKGTAAEISEHLKRQSMVGGQLGHQIKIARLEFEKSATAADKVTISVSKTHSSVKTYNRLLGESIRLKQQQLELEKKINAAQKEAIREDKSRSRGYGSERRVMELDFINRDRRQKALASRDHARALRDNAKRDSMSLWGGTTYDAAQREMGLAFLRRSQMQARLQEKERLQQEHLRRTRMRDAARAGLATVGFGAMSIGYQAMGMLDRFKLGGEVTGALSGIAKIAGGVINSTFGEILGHLASAIGSVLEGAFNVVANVIRGSLKAVLAGVSGFALSLVTVTLGGLLNVGIGLVVGVISYIVQIISSTIESIVDILKSIGQAITSILKAVFTMIQSIFEGIKTVVTKIWEGLWATLKFTVEAAMSIIEKTISAGVDEFASSFKRLVEEEKLAIKAFIQISDTYKGVGDRFKQGRKDVLELSDAIRLGFGINIQQAMSGSYMALSSYFRTAREASLITKNAAALSIQGQVDFGDAVRTVTDLLMAYKMKAEDAGEVTNILSGIVNVGKFELHDLTAYLKSVIGMAAALKIPIDELGASLVAMTHAGVPFNTASIGLNRLLMAATLPTKQNEKEWEMIGFHMKESLEKGKGFINTLKEMVRVLPFEDFRKGLGTVQGMRAFLGLVSQADKLDEDLKSIRESGAQFGNNTKIVLGTWDRIIARVKETKDILVDRGFTQPFTDAFRKMGISFVDIFQDFSARIKASGVVEYFSRIGEKLADGIGTSIRIIVQLLKKIDWEKTFNKIGDFLERVVDGFVKVLKDPETYNWIIRSALIFYESIKATYQFIKGLFTDFGNLSKMGDLIWNTLKEVFYSLGDFVKNIFLNVFNVVIDFFMVTFGSRLKENIKDIIAMLFQELQMLAGRLSGVLYELVKPPGEDVTGYKGLRTGKFYKQRPLGEKSIPFNIPGTPGGKFSGYGPIDLQIQGIVGAVRSVLDVFQDFKPSFGRKIENTPESVRAFTELIGKAENRAILEKLPIPGIKGNLMDKMPEIFKYLSASGTRSDVGQLAKEIRVKAGQYHHQDALSVSMKKLMEQTPQGANKALQDSLDTFKKLVAGLKLINPAVADQLQKRIDEIISTSWVNTEALNKNTAAILKKTDEFEISKSTIAPPTFAQIFGRKRWGKGFASSAFADIGDEISHIVFNIGRGGPLPAWGARQKERERKAEEEEERVREEEHKREFENDNSGPNEFKIQQKPGLGDIQSSLDKMVDFLSEIRNNTIPKFGVEPLQVVVVQEPMRVDPVSAWS